MIGGTTAGQGNIIAFNANYGVVIRSTTNAPVLGNSIYGNFFNGSGINSGLGIDLDGNGVTLDDACDSDEGANHDQNYPVLTLAQNDCGSAHIEGYLDSQPNTIFRLEFFANRECDPSGIGQGRFFNGSAEHRSGGNCSNPFSVTFPRLLSGWDT